MSCHFLKSEFDQIVLRQWGPYLESRYEFLHAYPTMYI